MPDGLRAVGLTDEYSMNSIIWPAFQHHIGSNAPLMYRQEVVSSRLLEGMQGGQPQAAGVDVLVVANPIAFVSSGLCEAYDQPYVDLYPASWTDDSRHWSCVYVQPVVIVYNALRATPPPGSWQDLADPRWEDRVILEDPVQMVSTGPAFAELQSVLGKAGLSQFMAGLAALRPRIVDDAELAVLSVATGSKWVGMTIWNVIRRARPNSPVRYTFAEPTPCVPGFALLSSTAQNPALARQFLTWLTSPEGQLAYSATGRVPALPTADTPLALNRVLPRGVTPVFGTVDWLSTSAAWVDRYRDVFGAPG
jgi:ABC-type Fe3+ transport system substrate-binding protein